MSLNMDVDGTTRAMNVLNAIGDDLNRAWRSAAADIDWLSGTWGRGPLGARFISAYRDPYNTFVRQTDEICPVPQAMAAAGRRCVAAYNTAEAHAEAELLRVGFR